MNKGIIITLPHHDYVTEYISQFSANILKEANKKNIKIKTLKGKKANREEFEEIVKKLDYKMIIFNGHGSDTFILGYKDNIIVESGMNDFLLKERITYARSCHAGKILGRECMKDNKEGCFIGYEIPFVFYIDDRWVSNPKKDEVAPLFIEPSNLVPISLIKGNTTIQAHENSKNRIIKNINKVLRKGDSDSFLFAGALWNNYIGQVIIGNLSATL